MIEARMTKVSLAKNLRRVLQARKGIAPKEAEAKGCPGNAKKIRFTVAYAESYRPNRDFVCVLFFLQARSALTVADSQELALFFCTEPPQNGKKGSIYHEKEHYF